MTFSEVLDIIAQWVENEKLKEHCFWLKLELEPLMLFMMKDGKAVLGLHTCFSFFASILNISTGQKNQVIYPCIHECGQRRFFPCSLPTC